MEIKNKIKRTTGGWIGKLKPEDKKIPVWGTVKTKHWNEAQKQVTELLKKYR